MIGWENLFKVTSVIAHCFPLPDVNQLYNLVITFNQL